LRRSWLEYAALDVCVLPDLHDALTEALTLAGKNEWARQEFQHQIRDRGRIDPEQRWRRTNSAGRLRTGAQRGALRGLWLLRDEIARSRDVAWHRVLRDQVMVDIAREQPATAEALASIPNIPRPVMQQSARWLAALAAGVAEPQRALERTDGPPPRSLRAWEQRDADAAARWVDLRQKLTERAEQVQVWVQTLLSPDVVADLAWTPPSDPAARMTELGARPWQIEQTIDLVGTA
jgi:ribonuclease D